MKRYACEQDKSYLQRFKRMLWWVVVRNSSWVTWDVVIQIFCTLDTNRGSICHWGFFKILKEQVGVPNNAQFDELLHTFLFQYIFFLFNHNTWSSFGDSLKRNLPICRSLEQISFKTFLLDSSLIGFFLRYIKLMAHFWNYFTYSYVALGIRE